MSFAPVKTGTMTLSTPAKCVYTGVKKRDRKHKAREGYQEEFP